MASLETRNGNFRLAFWFGGKKHRKNLRTSDPKEANEAMTHFQDTFRRVELGTLAVPDDADVVTFILSEGKVLRPPQTVITDETLSALFTEFFASVPAGANEQSTIDGMQTHRKHLERILGKNTSVRKLSEMDLQRFIDKRSEEKGHRGEKVTASTVKKALVTLRRVWQWGIRRGKKLGTWSIKGLEFGKGQDLPPFQTREEIERRIALGGLSKKEMAELWDALYLTLPEIDDVLRAAKENGRHGFIYPMFVVAAHTGARRAELLRCQVGDVDFVAGVVTIQERKKSHDRRTMRRVPMTPLLREVLTDWLKVHPGGPWLFSHEVKIERSKTKRSAPTPVTRNEAHDHFERTLEGSNWEKLRGWHTFRHSFISNLASKNVDRVCRKNASL